MKREPLINPAPTSEMVSKSMRGNVAKGTSPELRLRRLLREAGRGGYRLHWKVAGRPDIAYPGRKVAIFVNGCYWHRCPSCQPPMPKSNTEFWAEKFRRNQERDERKRSELEEAGWTVLTVWECQIRDEPANVARSISEVLERASSS